jgi:hypothetical protein
MKEPEQPRPVGKVILPASHREVEPGRGELQGYATHTGEARSTADVAIRGGTAPLLEREEDDEDEESEAALADAIPASGNAPD